MADLTKYQPIINGGTLFTDMKSLFSIIKTRRTVAFAYGFMFAFIIFTIFLVFNSSTNIFNGTNSFNTDSLNGSSSSSRSHSSSIFSYFFPNTSIQQNNSVHLSPPVCVNSSRSSNVKNITDDIDHQEPLKANSLSGNQTILPVKEDHNQSFGLSGNQTVLPVKENQNQSYGLSGNQTILPVKEDQNQSFGKNGSKVEEEKSVSSNYSSSFEKKQIAGTLPVSGGSVKEKDYLESLKNCDFFDGEWVYDDSYPHYKPGSCSLIDEQFNCFLNGRPDKNFQKLKWKPKGCNLPRLDGSRMLDLLKGKRLVFVGDSLNRNMWESLVCILRNSVKDRSKVFEAHGRHLFRGEAAYSFIFKDYNFTVEFFASPFLVREWEMLDKNGKKKETLRLDLVGKSSDQYKGADIIVFNTGHWWTHEKTAKGKDYYQEGSHIYGELNVLEAFRKAITTWARWVDKNVNPMKSMVFFRGYSESHFSGGQWNSGGQCNSETEPIKNETFLRPYPPKMIVLEKVLKGMKTQVTYLNVTKMTDFRKDGHPSIYRKPNLSEEEKKSSLRFQDCSHWCLPGVPDVWNEILYAELLLKQKQQKRA